MERIVGAEGIHGIGHGVDVPVVGLDALVEDFGAAALLADDGGHAALHGFEGRNAEGLAHGGHHVDIAVGKCFVHLLAFHEAGEVEAVGNALARRHLDHIVHHVARTCHAEANVVGTLEHEGGCLNEVLGTFLHRDAAEEGNHFFLAPLMAFAALAHHLQNVVGKGVDGIVHRDALGGVLVVMVDDRLAREFGNAHDAIGVVHTVLLNAVDRGVHIAARTVEVGGVHVNDEGLAAHALGVNACGIGEPVVGVDDVELLLAGNDACHDGIVVDFVVQVFGIAAGKLYAAQVVGEAIVEVGIDMVAQGEVEFGRHLIAEALLHVVVVYIAPHYGRSAQPDDVHKTFVLVAPRLGQAERYLHVGLHRQAFGDAVAGSAESAQDVRGKLPTEH